MSWKLEGTYMETCNCNAACPCVFLSDPTNDDCTVLVGWHIDKGSDGDVSLDGLNVVFAVHSPGNMVQVQWNVAVYVDERASDAQKESLVKIFGGQAGGHPAALASHVGQILGVAPAAIEFKAGDEDKSFSLKVGGVGEAHIERVDGQGGGPIQVSGHPVAIAPGYPATLYKSTNMSYSDHGMSWSESGRTAFFSPFSYAG